MITIIILKNILKKNKAIELIEKNNNKVLKLPMNAPNNNLYKGAPLFSITDVVNNRRKSIEKFNNKTKST